MAKILLGISLLLIIATSYLSFATKAKVEVIKVNLQETKTTLASTKSTLAKTETKLKTTEDELTTAKATIDERDKEITKQKSEIEKATKDLADATKLVEEKAGELAKVSEELGSYKTKFAGVDPDQLKAMVDTLTADVEKAKTELKEALQVQGTLEQQKKDADSKLATTQRTVDEYKVGFVRNGLSGKVLAYNPGWNFVVLSLGDKQGIKANAQMLVVRNGESIAKVKVTNVEPGTSIADIVPGSLTRGASVQPGDSVVFESKR